jgi:hypothetical protein
VPSSPIDVFACHLEHITVADPLTSLPTLAELLDTIPDLRSRQGRRYRLGPLLAPSPLAVLGGATSLAKITYSVPAMGTAFTYHGRPRPDIGPTFGRSHFTGPNTSPTSTRRTSPAPW